MNNKEIIMYFLILIRNFNNDYLNILLSIKMFIVFTFHKYLQSRTYYLVEHFLLPYQILEI